MGDGTWEYLPETDGITAISIPMYEGDVTGNQEYIKIGNEATSKIATIVHQKR